MENPYSTKPIKPWLWKHLIYLPWFQIQYSHVNWFERDLRQRIKMEQEKLLKLSEISPYLLS
ncbi:MAG: hypothetical protein AAGE84_25645 [Cyanobacteria bacterium P01_G01_bin.39]